MKHTIPPLENGMRANGHRLVRRVLQTAVAATLAVPCIAALAAGTSYYYEGARKVEINLQGDLVADFSKNRSTAAAVAPAALGGASAALVTGDSMVRIYRTPAVVARSAEAIGQAPSAAGGSPVYAQGSTRAGRLMALPGGVLVKFKPEWSRAQIDAWLAARGLVAGHPLNFGVNWFLVQTAPGAASLAAANAIYESGEVLSASPNWWMQTSAK